MMNKHRKKQLPPFHPRCMKNTKDDWYPNYPKNQVMVSIQQCYPLPCDVWKVLIKGNDDYALEIEYPTKMDAKRMYTKVTSMKYVNKQDLIELGFKTW